MFGTANLPLFLASVIALSLTGVMMPGPVSAVAFTKGLERREAGILVALGHALVEFPLILLIHLGFASYLTLPEVKTFVGLAGGLVLIWMATGMFRTRILVLPGGGNPVQGPVLAGVATTAGNPYFFLWWATIGAALLTNAQAFPAGVAALALAHWLCDLGWLYLLSWSVFQSRRLWTPKLQRLAFAGCASVLAGFGMWFIFSSLRSVLGL